LDVIPLGFSRARRLLLGGGCNLWLLSTIVLALAVGALVLVSAFRLALVVAFAALLVALAAFPAVAIVASTAIVTGPAIASLGVTAVAVSALVVFTAGFFLGRAAFVGAGKEAAEGFE